MTSPATVFANVTELLTAKAPAKGRQAALFDALQQAYDALVAAGIPVPESAGWKLGDSREVMDRAAVRASEVGEPGTWVASHDALVYTPHQAVVTLHRYLVALGWTTTTESLPYTSSPIFSRALWRSAFDRGGLAGTHNPTTPQRTPSTLQPAQVIDLEAWRIPGGRKGKALSCYLPPGAQRNEVVADTIDMIEGYDLWFGFSFLLSRNFPLEQDFYHTLARFVQKTTTGEPPITMQVRSGELVIVGGGGSPVLPQAYRVSVADVRVKEWIDVQLHVKFSRDPSIGYFDVFVNGEPKIEGYAPSSGTLYATSAANTATQAALLNYGLFRNPACKREATVWHMGVAMGSSQGSVFLPGSS